MENLDRSQLPRTLHLIDGFGTAVLTQVKDAARPGSVFRYTATLNANEDQRRVREDAQALESPCAASGDLEVNDASHREESNEDLAALHQLSKTAPRMADLDRLMKRHPVPQAYHDEPGWEDDAG